MGSLIEMLKEGNTLSLTRFISVISWVVWIIVTIYLVLTNHSWGNYGEFTAAAGTAALGCAPAYTYSTTDLTAGSSALTTGTLYIVYE